METALKEAGTCGRFQVCHVIFTQLPRFVSVWGIMIMMFGSYNPGWRCKDIVAPLGSSFRNSSGFGGDDVANNISLPSSFGNTLRENMQNKTSLSGANRQGYKDQSTNATRFGNLSLTMVTKGNVYNETCDVMEWCSDVEFNPASNTVVSEFKLVCGRKWILKVMLLVMSVGFLTGALAGGQVGEKFGRKVSLYGGCFIMFVFSLLAIFSTHWVMYTVCLFLIGAGGNVIQSTASIFSMEYLNSKWRSVFGSIPTWNISLCIFTFATALMKSWVHVHIVASALSLAACVGYFILSESVRWLVVHRKYDQAAKVIKRVARFNKKPSPTDDTVLRLKEETENNSEMKTNSSSPLSSSSTPSSSSKTTYTYVHLFKSKRLRILTIKFSVIFFMIFVTYFALSFGINSLPGDFYVNVVASSVCEISVVVITGPLCNKIGRRWGGLVVSTIGAISCFGIVVALYASEGEVQSTAIKTFAFLARSGSQAKSVVATLFMAELYPTAVRNVAYGMFRAMAGIGGLFGPFLIPEPTRDSFAVCFSIMACGFVLCLGIFLSFSETNKLCLVDRIDVTVKTPVDEEECV